MRGKAAIGTQPTIVLAIDPGSAKCGLAVVARAGGILHQSVVETAELGGELAALAARLKPDAILVGNGTNSAAVLQTARQLDIAPVTVVDERDSTLAARKRYFQANPPRGLRRLIPVSLQTPPRPYDDFVAVILAERYLQDQLRVES